MARRESDGVNRRAPSLRAVRSRPSTEDESGAGATDVSAADLVTVFGANLRRLRTKRGLSLERMAKLSGVSRALLSQIELAQSAPTVDVVWRIATALGVPFGTLLGAEADAGPQLLPRAKAKRLTSQDGAFTSRALFPFDAPRRAEFYELCLRGHAQERAAAHAPGTTENLVVAQGRAVLSVDGSTFRLGTGDAIMFAADVPHTYANPDSTESVLYLVMTYAPAK